MLFMNASMCECGNAADGETTTYAVGQGADCCDSPALAMFSGYTNTWETQNNGNHVIIDTDVHTASDAQDKCCRN